MQFHDLYNDIKWKIRQFAELIFLNSTIDSNRKSRNEKKNYIDITAVISRSMIRQPSPFSLSETIQDISLFKYETLIFFVQVSSTLASCHFYIVNKLNPIL